MFVLEGRQYRCAEQYYQSQKCLEGGNAYAADEVMLEKDPVIIKKIGDSVKIDYKRWINGKGSHVMLTGLHAKFSQNQGLRDALINTGDKSMVECNRYDTNWGIGLALKDEEATDCTTWKGENLLGLCLDRIREDLN